MQTGGVTTGARGDRPVDVGTDAIRLVALPTVVEHSTNRAWLGNEAIHPAAFTNELEEGFTRGTVKLRRASVLTSPEISRAAFDVRCVLRPTGAYDRLARHLVASVGQLNEQAAVSNVRKALQSGVSDRLRPLVADELASLTAGWIPRLVARANAREIGAGPEPASNALNRLGPALRCTNFSVPCTAETWSYSERHWPRQLAPDPRDPERHGAQRRCRRSESRHGGPRVTLVAAQSPSIVSGPTIHDGMAGLALGHAALAIRGVPDHDRRARLAVQRAQLLLERPGPDNWARIGPGAIDGVASVAYAACVVGSLLKDNAVLAVVEPVLRRLQAVVAERDMDGYDLYSGPRRRPSGRSSLRGGDLRRPCRHRTIASVRSSPHTRRRRPRRKRVLAGAGATGAHRNGPWRLGSGAGAGTPHVIHWTPTLRRTRPPRSRLRSGSP